MEVCLATFPVSSAPFRGEKFTPVFHFLLYMNYPGTEGFVLRLCSALEGCNRGETKGRTSSE